jgi:hypothetical protein
MQIPGDCLEEMAGKGTKFGPLGNFKKLHQADVLKILQLAQ